MSQTKSGHRSGGESTERSGGHALFAVELIRELKASGSLQRNAEGRWTESPRIAWDRSPARIEGLLAGSFERLDRQALKVPQVASVEATSSPPTSSPPSKG